MVFISNLRTKTFEEWDEVEFRFDGGKPIKVVPDLNITVFTLNYAKRITSTIITSNIYKLTIDKLNAMFIKAIMEHNKDSSLA